MSEEPRKSRRERANEQARRAQQKRRKHHNVRTLRHLRKTKRRQSHLAMTEMERQETYAPIRLAQLEQFPFCQIKAAASCSGYAVQVHHKAGRTGQNLFLHLMSACPVCHSWVHGNEAEARRRRFLI